MLTHMLLSPGLFFAFLERFVDTKDVSKHGVGLNRVHTLEDDVSEEHSEELAALLVGQLVFFFLLPVEVWIQIARV